MEQQTKFDVIIIGGGQAGYTTAIQAVSSGLRTALIENKKIGGNHINSEAVSLRSLYESANLLEKIRKAKEFGLESGAVIPKWQAITKRAITVSAKLSKYVELGLQRRKVQLFKSGAYLSNPGEVTLTSTDNSETITGENIVIATGAKPVELPGVLFDDKLFISPGKVVYLKNFPKRIMIVSGNERGVELANLFAILGSNVTLIENEKRILPFMDNEISGIIRRLLDNREIIIHTNAKVTGVVQGKDNYQYVIEKPEGSFKVYPDTCIVTAGMKANISELGLEDAGIKTVDDFIKVDKHMQTNVTGIFALGNCTKTPRQLHAVRSEASSIINTITGEGKSTVTFTSIPTCIYTQPEVASIGLSEVEAGKSGYNTKTAKVFFNTNGRAVTIDRNEGFVKLIVDMDRDRLLGAQIVGHSATELIGEISLVMGKNIPVSSLSTNPHPSPTLSEVIMEAAGKV